MIIENMESVIKDENEHEAALTLALRNTRLIALTGLIVGFTASLSMAASEYLSTKADKVAGIKPLKSSIYTGTAYTATMMVLILP
jgi:VIT1/CCC1 family predicted Fe2+/Mn2+ transporter